MAAKKIKSLTGKMGDFSGIVLKAAARGDAPAVRHYLAENPDWLNQEGPHYRTMLWEAAYKGRTELVAELITLGADVNPMASYYTPMLVDLSALAVAREAGNEALVALLQKHGAVDDLYAACHRGDLDAIEALLADNPEAVHQPSRDEPFHPRVGLHPIHYAVVGGQAEAVKLLVEHGAQVGEFLPLLLDWAVGDAALKKYLRAQAKRSKKTPPAGATPEKLKGVPVIDQPDWGGFPLLVDACRGNHNAPDNPARVRRLLDRGANVNVRDHKNKTALHRASQAGFVKITRLLLKSGAELEAEDAKGITPLHEAAQYGRVEALKLLIKHGASLAHLEARGESPLFSAARGAHLDAVAFLLDAGLDAQQQNRRGKTVAEVVGAARHQTAERKAILALLKKRSGGQVRK